MIQPAARLATPAVPQAVPDPIRIVGGRVLLADGEIAETALVIEDGWIAALDAGRPPADAREIDAAGRLVLPGMVDLHGDSFERQIMPRPGVAFPLPLALHDSDRQIAVNGITTAYHGLTCSWEPGLRGIEAARRFLAALDAVRPTLAVDTRLHLRFETFNLDAVEEAIRWMETGRIDLLAFNDHTPGMAKKAARDPDSLASTAERAGLGKSDFVALLNDIHRRAPDVADAMARLAAAGRAADVPMASHDDRDVATRDRYHALGCGICEFPMTREAAARARSQGGATVFGAPNVLRGGSHIGLVGAAEMIAERLCDVLTTDYYYPAMLLAPFRLAADGVLPLGEAWRLVSANPARAAGLTDRGEIALGRRADVIVVDDSDPTLPRTVASLVAGRVVYGSDALQVDR